MTDTLRSSSVDVPGLSALPLTGLPQCSQGDTTPAGRHSRPQVAARLAMGCLNDKWNYQS